MEMNSGRMAHHISKELHSGSISILSTVFSYNSQDLAATQIETPSSSP